jgi:hypothetical protein
MMLCWGLAAAASFAALGQTFSPEGGENAIAGSLPGDQTFPQAAIDSNGGCLVWQDNAVSTSGLRIRAARLNGDLTLSGSNLVVSSRAKTKSIGDQQKPSVALFQNGDAVIVWQEGRPAYQQIYARFVGTTGSLIGKDIRVSSRPKNSQTNPRVVVLADGAVLIVWSSELEDGDMQGIYARRYSPDGKALGAEFQVNQYYLHNQRDPAVAALADGGFVVAWISELQRGAASVDVYTRIFDASATGGSEFVINASTTNSCANPALASSPQGGFLVAWSQNSTTVIPTATTSSGTIISSTALVSTARSTDGWDVYGALYDASGTAVTPAPVRLNTYTYGDQFGPKLAALGTNYIAVWSSLSQTNSLGKVDPWEGVYGQFVTGSGSLVLPEDLHVNTTTLGRQIHPAVTSDANSRFLVVWSSVVLQVGRFDSDVFGQIYQQSTP